MLLLFGKYIHSPTLPLFKHFYLSIIISCFNFLRGVVVVVVGRMGGGLKGSISEITIFTEHLLIASLHEN